MDDITFDYIIEFTVILEMVESKCFNEWTRTGFWSADAGAQSAFRTTDDSLLDWELHLDGMVKRGKGGIMVMMLMMLQWNECIDASSSE